MRKKEKKILSWFAWNNKKERSWFAWIERLSSTEKSWGRRFTEFPQRVIVKSQMVIVVWTLVDDKRSCFISLSLSLSPTPICFYKFESEQSWFSSLVPGISIPLLSFRVYEKFILFFSHSFLFIDFSTGFLFFWVVWLITVLFHLGKLSVEMGCFSCCDSSDDEKLNPVAESKGQKQFQPTVSNNISGLPSGFLIESFTPFYSVATCSQDLLIWSRFS